MILWLNLLVILLQKAEAGRIVLNSVNFYENVESNSKTWLILYGNSGVIADDAIAGFSERLESVAGVNFGVVDCAEKLNKKMCNFIPKEPKLGMFLYAGQPSLNPYTKKFYRGQPKPFNGEFNSREIERFVASSLPHTIQKITSVTLLSYLI